jgi:hypothetical protein
MYREHFRVVEFQTEEDFPPLMHGLEEMVHLMCSQMAVGNQKEC